MWRKIRVTVCHRLHQRRAILANRDIQRDMFSPIYHGLCHTCKKSIIGRALARFFCGLLIGSAVGINATWISTVENKIADEISRIKKSTHDSFSFQYDFAKLQQDHPELRHCRFFQPSQELLSMIWDILLTRNSPDLNKVRLLKQSGLGKLNI